MTESADALLRFIPLTDPHHRKTLSEVISEPDNYMTQTQTIISEGYEPCEEHDKGAQFIDGYYFRPKLGKASLKRAIEAAEGEFSYAERVGELEGELKVEAEEHNDLKDDIKTLEAEIENLEGTIETKNELIAELQEELRTMAKAA